MCFSPRCRSAPRRCASSPARWCRCSTIRSSLPARSPCSTQSRAAALDVGFARAFLPHEFRRFGISPDELSARFHEGLDQIDLLLTQETPRIAGNFIPSRTSRRCRGRPRRRGRNSTSPRRGRRSRSNLRRASGHSLMTIPIGPIKPLVELYRKFGARPAIPATAR